MNPRPLILGLKNKINGIKIRGKRMKAWPKNVIHRNQVYRLKHEWNKISSFVSRSMFKEMCTQRWWGSGSGYFWLSESGTFFHRTRPVTTDMRNYFFLGQNILTRINKFKLRLNIFILFLCTSLGIIFSPLNNDGL